ncbi:hypothetical protein FRACA_1380012 [Frankia canadensis]|uniref:Uncharacterized protein n=1 Tax=Frankia canadensis TaxID=1836972 RepID=A0A2I2KL63_9ACTN|nr:hypothetical protein FRACA_1380012 [Frankia canadensis]SOU53667.1 hypothetical protein FRACA_1380012 [Frankia canadensis]
MERGRGGDADSADRENNEPDDSESPMCGRVWRRSARRLEVTPGAVPTESLHRPRCGSGLNDNLPLPRVVDV